MSETFVKLVQGLDEEAANELYESPWAVRAVLQALPPLGKQYAIRLIHVEDWINQSLLGSWIAKGAESEHAAAIGRMLQLRVLIQSEQGKVRMHTGFRERLCEMVYEGLSEEEGLSDGKGGILPSEEELNAHASARWDSVLLQLLPDEGAGYGMNGEGGGDGGWLEPAKLFRVAGLVTEEGDVTESGLHFLMSGTEEQLWGLMRQYVAEAQQRGSKGVAVVAFALRLGFQKEGRPYKLNRKEELEASAARDFSRMGLVYLLGEDEQGGLSYVPTGLASVLLGRGEEERRAAGHGEVIVETNMRVYAYTTSPVQLAVLRMMARPELRLPNLFAGTITRERVRSAVSKGATAQRMVAYLRLHAHPEAHRRGSPLPDNVADQVRLWEREMSRMQSSPAALYTEFKSVRMFERVCQRAKEIGALLWHSPSDQERTKLACSLGAKEQMDQIIKEERRAEKALTQGGTAHP